MKKNERILLVLIIFTILNLVAIKIYASDINMNLSTSETSTQTNSFNQNTYNTNNENQNTYTNSGSYTQEDSTPRITSVTTSENDNFLNAENVLSIIIIVIGILLVFLGIAIIVRFK